MDILHACEVFGLTVGASKDEIEQAYRELLQVWHPDRFVQNQSLRAKAEKKTQEINVAYQVLCDSMQAGQYPPLGSTAGTQMHESTQSSSLKSAVPPSENVQAHMTRPPPPRPGGRKDHGDCKQ